MVENINSGTDISISKTQAVEAINKMLDCLLSKDKGCKTCKNCERTDICGFLMEAVFAFQHGEVIPSILTQLKLDNNNLKS